MSQYEHLPIYKKLFDLAVYLENIVKGFSRYYKYTLGSELRILSHRAVMLVVKANSAQDKKELLYIGAVLFPLLERGIEGDLDNFISKSPLTPLYKRGEY
ncbi:MAG: hypothetical protein ABII74_01625 [Elusimicrobiota bacterium]